MSNFKFAIIPVWYNLSELNHNFIYELRYINRVYDLRRQRRTIKIIRCIIPLLNFKY
jgi:hypothetical protein